jgi:hypothetical protein
MNERLKRGMFLGALLVGAAYCYGDTFQLGSFATGNSNLGNINTAMNFGGFSTSNVISGGTANTFSLNPAGVWEAAAPNSTWVGYAATAGPLSGVNPPTGFYTYTTSFTAFSDFTGVLNVAADDTTEVFLNGTELVPDGQQGSDALCADGIPNCRILDTIAISGNAGVNTITFVVSQTGQQDNTDDPSGVMFDGDISEVPEPSGLALVGTGLILFSRLVRRKMNGI